MPKANVFNMAGEKIGEIQLSEAIFGIEPNKSVLHDSVKNHLANCRQGTQSALTKGEVSYTTRKPWRQKGTGRARAGYAGSPVWYHGGVAFAPKPRDYSYTLNKKVKRLALKSALSAKAADAEIIVIDGLKMDEIKTKAFKTFLTKIGVEGKALVVTENVDEAVIKSARNIAGVSTTVAGIPVGGLTREEALEIAEKIDGEDILDLVSLANKVRKKFAREIAPCSILNAKSGVCAQNCRFCAQSRHHNTGIETYDLLPAEEVLEAARKAYDTGVRAFGYVTSGYGYKTVTPEFRQILDTLDLLHKELPELKICVSIGILSRETAKLLAEHHAWRYNMNLQTSPKRYAELIADTHTIEDKIATIKYLQEFGVTNCTGGIFGLGENWEDRVDMAFVIRDLNVEGTQRSAADQGDAARRA